MNKEEVKQILNLLIEYQESKEDELIRKIFEIFQPYTLQKELIGDDIIFKTRDAHFTLDSFKRTVVSPDGIIHSKLIFCALAFYAKEDWLGFGDSDIEMYANIQHLNATNLLLKLQ